MAARAKGDGREARGRAAKPPASRFMGTGRDRLTQEQRSRLMARVKGKDTGPETRVAALLEARGIACRRHAKDLPGTPDFVLLDARVVVLVDGDFWHGYRFDAWKGKLSDHWRAKIAANVRRDARNRKLLREAGWGIVRLWEHSLKRDPARCMRRVTKAMAERG